MFRRSLIPVWVAIILVTSMYLMGQGWSPESGPPAPVPKTGQTTSYGDGDDGELESGVAWPDPRFTDNLDGTVTDNLTGLIWTKAADCHYGDWPSSLDFCNAMADGTCGLSDGSSAGDWRLANVKEYQSLIDFENHNPALPTGHPFTNVHSVHWYRSSTTDSSSTDDAWYVYLYDGLVANGKKYGIYELLCVRDGQ